MSYLDSPLPRDHESWTSTLAVPLETLLSFMSYAVSITSSQIERDRFGPPLSISDQSLIGLACNIRREISSDSFTDAKLGSRLSGSYNLVHIIEFDDGFRFVIRVPGTGWGDRFTPSAKRCFVSQAFTMRFVRKETTISLPEVYACDPSSSNLIGAPYIAMSFIDGHPVSSKWNDTTGPTPKEERRLRILDTVAQAMAQLQKFEFEMIGSLESENGESESRIRVGPCYAYDDGDFGDDNYDQDLQVDESGPFDSSKSCLRHYTKYYKDHEKIRKDVVGLTTGPRALVDMIIPSLPLSTKRASSKHETFVLSLPDFGPQNVMVDEQGNLTGFIDWDEASTQPRWIGSISFPPWITRDWDPLMYNYPDSEREDSPEELRRYRQIYSRKMREMLRGVGNWRFANKAHIFEAACIAVCAEANHLEILRKMVARVCRIDDDQALDTIWDLGDGKLASKEIDKLRKGFQLLFSVPRH